MPLCLQCKKWVNQTKGKRAKKFCNDTCRSNYRHAKNKKKKEIPFVEPPVEAYDGPKLPPSVQDEPLSFANLKANMPPIKGYNEYAAELEQAEDLGQLERVGRQIEKSSLGRRDKELLKAHGISIARNKFID
jgi:hypothetical protein